ncbi:hypothetical protein BH09PSE1_BH09PSE1_20170 [soil metagenome]
MTGLQKTCPMGLLALLATGSLALQGCAGVLDWCGDGLNQPAGGWDRHGPG